MMDDSEKLAEKYLNHRGVKGFVFEPGGKGTTPDFGVDNNIAIEVTRLNEKHVVAGSHEGQETAATSLCRCIKELLSSLGPPSEGKSWFVSYEFCRPLPKWTFLQKRIRNALIPLIDDVGTQIHSFDLAPNFRLTVRPAGSIYDTAFRIGMSDDRQSGGLLFEIMRRNLQICICKKAMKAAKANSIYKEWWLVLPDYIGFGLTEFDQSLFREQVSLDRSKFKRVILLDPRDYTRSFEV